MTGVWFTSDTHFLHGMVAGLRGFADPAEYDELIIERWNKTIRRDELGSPLRTRARGMTPTITLWLGPSLAVVVRAAGVSWGGWFQPRYDGRRGRLHRMAAAADPGTASLARGTIELGNNAEWQELSSGVLVTGDGTETDHWHGTWPMGDSTLTRLMEANDPRDTIARCEAELAILDEHATDDCRSTARRGPPLRQRCLTPARAMRSWRGVIRIPAALSACSAPPTGISPATGKNGPLHLL